MTLLVPWRRLDLSLKQEVWCLVDDDDYPWIVERNWNFGWHNKTPWKYYAKRNTGPERSTVYLHREIMIRADPQTIDFQIAHHVDHINGQSLDNRKANLRWLTPAENRAHRIERSQIPSLPSIIRMLAAKVPLVEDIPFAA